MLFVWKLPRGQRVIRHVNILVVFLIRQIQLPQPGFELLAQDALNEGYQFLQRMDEPWTALYGAFDQDQLVAIGGLTPDPFLPDPKLGRIRRIYVKASHRKRGIATAVVTHLLSEAARTFHHVCLRAENPSAVRLYEKLGFQPFESPDATHIFTIHSAA